MMPEERMPTACTPPPLLSPEEAIDLYAPVYKIRPVKKGPGYKKTKKKKK